MTEANIEILHRVAGPGNYHDAPCRLILASLQIESGDESATERLCQAARDWALARDAKQVLCWSALVQARIELARLRLLQRSPAEARSLLTEALNRRQPLHDPEPERNGQKFQLNCQQYNYRAAEPHSVLTDLRDGVLTQYPLKPSVIAKLEESVSVATNKDEKPQEFDAFLSHNIKYYPGKVHHHFPRIHGHGIQKRYKKVWKKIT